MSKDDVKNIDPRDVCKFFPLEDPYNRLEMPVVCSRFEKGMNRCAGCGFNPEVAKDRLVKLAGVKTADVCVEKSKRLGEIFKVTGGKLKNDVHLK